MRCFALLAILIASFLSAHTQKPSTTPPLIPIPVSIQSASGNFTLKKTASIEISAEAPDAKRVANFLSQKLSVATGYSIPVKTVKTISETPGNIRLSIVNNASPGKEGYTLVVNPTAISITANAPAGLFYGMQSLIQLFPKEIESSSFVRNYAWSVPSVGITDYPRFGWRALLFDVSRHFFTKQDVKSFVDNMVQYKYNLLHLHLTDDQGWRIEIKGLPNLTKVGAWRPKREGAWGNTKTPDPSDRGS